MNRRKRLFWYIVEKVARVPEGTVIPRWARAIHYLLLPIESLRIDGLPKLYDLRRDVWTIEGREYSGAIFRAWAVGGLESGSIFELVENEEGGPLTIRVIRRAHPEDGTRDEMKGLEDAGHY